MTGSGDKSTLFQEGLSMKKSTTNISSDQISENISRKIRKPKRSGFKILHRTQKPYAYTRLPKEQQTLENMLKIEGFSLLDLEKCKAKALQSLNIHEFEMWLQIEEGIL